jgi:hypothetical protein
VRISLSASGLRDMTWHEAAWRFVLGGTVTAVAGAIAHKYGPSIGGLFLVFPAILPTSLTLVAKHQERRKAKLGLHGAVRGMQAAALDARGALIATTGLIGFALVVRRLARSADPVVCLVSATAVWFVVAGSAWWLCQFKVTQNRRRWNR